MSNTNTTAKPKQDLDLLITDTTRAMRTKPSLSSGLKASDTMKSEYFLRTMVWKCPCPAASHTALYRK